ncbi:MAG: universal stress protein [Nitrospirae bacterium]|nr:universal stress protein [Nitrospirota bacterium]MBF0536323.1 universal stress protein [Nitrospirota bacterium]MBF0618264.1 universal stress protein [Nitrospirota bacterium]
MSNEIDFRALICIDGSTEALAGMRYGAKLGTGLGAALTIMHVRGSNGNHASTVGTTGVSGSGAAWGVAVPEINYLVEAKDTLTYYGWMDEKWNEEQERKFEGNPLEDFQIMYQSPDKGKITLKMTTGHNVAAKILSEVESGGYSLVIMGASKKMSVIDRILLSSEVQKVVVHAPCAVLVARELEAGHGHLFCLDGSEKTYNALIKDLMLANLCSCPVSIISVAENSSKESEANDIIKEGARLAESLGLKVDQKIVAVGNPVEEIISHGRNYSVIVVGADTTTGLKRFFMGGTAFNIVLNAENSVMVVR